MKATMKIKVTEKGVYGSRNFVNEKINILIAECIDRAASLFGDATPLRIEAYSGDSSYGDVMDDAFVWIRPNESAFKINDRIRKHQVGIDIKSMFGEFTVNQN